MLLKIPTRSVADENYSELFNFEIQGDQNQIRKISSQLEQIKYVISYFSKSKNVSDEITIRISVQFLKKYQSDFLGSFNVFSDSAFYPHLCIPGSPPTSYQLNGYWCAVRPPGKSTEEHFCLLLLSDSTPF